jgi:hypothetical protein
MSLKAVFTDILNFHSHKMAYITVLIKEDTITYLEDDTNFIMNVTSFKMDTYSDSDGTPGRATIIPTKTPQAVKSSKSMFSAVDDPTLRLNEVIFVGIFYIQKHL